MRTTICVLALALGACSASTEVQSTRPAAAEVQDWPARWCSVRPGMTPDQLVAAMGAPSKRGAEYMTWAAFEYSFNAFLGADGTIRQMDASEGTGEQSDVLGGCTRIRVR